MLLLMKANQAAENIMNMPIKKRRRKDHRLQTLLEITKE
jgi:hypothetical protein